MMGGDNFVPDHKANAMKILQDLTKRGALEQVPQDMRGRLLNTACLDARNPDMVKVLLDHGFKPTAIGPDGHTTVIELVRRASEGKDNWPPNPIFKTILDLLEAAQKSAAPSPTPAKPDAALGPPPALKATIPRMAGPPLSEHTHLPTAFDYGPFTGKNVIVEADFSPAGLSLDPDRMMASPDGEVWPVYQGQLFAVGKNSLTMHLYSVAKGMTSVSVEKSRIRRIELLQTGLLIAN